MNCKECGAPADDDYAAELCLKCAERLWATATDEAKDRCFDLAPIVYKTTRGPGEAVLSLIMLAYSIYRSNPGLPGWEFYIKIVTDAGARIPDFRPKRKQSEPPS